MTTAKRINYPKGLHQSGKRLWRDVLEEYELDVHEELLLLQAARCADRLDQLAVEAAGAPTTVTNAKGDQVANPLLTESRQQSITLTRLIASLRLPSDEEDVRPQRRGAARGAYGPNLKAVRA